MLSVDPFDKYLDPPEYPTHGPCDHCGEVFDNGDLNHVKRPGVDLWLCDECLEIFEQEGDDGNES